MTRLTEWCETNQISYTTAWRMRKSGTFPHPTFKQGREIYVLTEEESAARTKHSCPVCGTRLDIEIDIKEAI